MHAGVGLGTAVEEDQSCRDLLYNYRGTSGWQPSMGDNACVCAHRREAASDEDEGSRRTSARIAEEQVLSLLLGLARRPPTHAASREEANSIGVPACAHHPPRQLLRTPSSPARFVGNDRFCNLVFEHWTSGTRSAGLRRRFGDGRIRSGCCEIVNSRSRRCRRSINETWRPARLWPDERCCRRTSA